MRANMLLTLLLIATVYGVAGTCNTAGAVCSHVEAGIPLGQTHSHNTYEHPEGIRDALVSGFCSFEADFFYNGSALWIAHDQVNITPSWTMQSKYLDPFAEIITANGGDVYPASRVFGGCRQIILLCDAKEYNNDVSEEAARKQFDALMAVLKEYENKYPGMFTIFYKDGTTVPGAINVYVSGLRPSPDYVAAMDERPLALDGRVIENLDNAYGPSVYPLVSQDFADVCPVPSPPDTASLATFSKFQASCIVKHADVVVGYIKKAHEQHRIIRFWATIDTPAVWDALINAGVDLVNVDALTAFRAFAFEKWGPVTALYAYEKNGQRLQA